MNTQIPGHISVYDSYLNHRYEGKFINKHIGIWSPFHFVKRTEDPITKEPLSRYSDTHAFDLPFNIDIQKLNNLLENQGFYGPMTNCQIYILKATYEHHVILLIPVIISIIIGQFLLIGWMASQWFMPNRSKDANIWNYINMPILGQIDDISLDEEKEITLFKNLTNSDEFLNLVQEKKKK
jgi:hypothetical protein